MKKTIVSKLDEKTLMYSDVVWDYYLRNWKFSTINYNNQFVNIPILKEASHIIEKQNDSYPWKSYIDGFISEYSKPLARDLEPTVYLSQVQPNPPLPVAPGGFSSSNAIDYGIKMARAFKVWEYIAEKLPEFEVIILDKKIDKSPSEKVRTLFLQLAFVNKKFGEIELNNTKETKEYIKKFGNDNGLILNNKLLNVAYNSSSNLKSDIELFDEAVKLYKKVFKEEPKIIK